MVNEIRNVLRVRRSRRYNRRSFGFAFRNLADWTLREQIVELCL
jgi:hypothetical protein